MEEVNVEGYEALRAKLSGVSAGKRVFVLFSGSKSATGASWCPDCVKAEPVVKAAAHKLLGPGDLFIYCTVGQRDAWKDPNNAFRKDTQFRLSCVPTLIQIGTGKRLGDAECSKESLVEMVFEEE